MDMSIVSNKSAKRNRREDDNEQLNQRFNELAPYRPFVRDNAVCLAALN